MTYFDELIKPAWAPPAPAYGLVWSILYPIIFVAFGYVAVRVTRGTIPSIVLLPIAINLLANFAFTPIQFGLRNLPLASVDIVLLLVTSVWCITAIWPHSRLAAAALVPYLAWVSIATVLQLEISWLNR